MNKSQKHYPKYRHADTKDINEVSRLFDIAKNNSDFQ